MDNQGKKHGLFITLEGPEGGGKTSQAKVLAERLRQKGLVVSVTREPGGTPVSDKIRQLLIDPANRDMLPMTELLLFEASRFQHVQQLILPKLQRGEVVICDRFYDSSLAYQGARDLPLQVVIELNNLVAADCKHNTVNKREDKALICNIVCILYVFCTEVKGNQCVYPNTKTDYYRIDEILNREDKRQRRHCVLADFSNKVAVNNVVK